MELNYGQIRDIRIRAEAWIFEPIRGPGMVLQPVSPAEVIALCDEIADLETRLANAEEIHHHNPQGG